MITVIAKLPVKEGKMDEAMAAFQVLISKVASEEGTVLYSLNRDKANPDVLVVVEQYKDKAARSFIPPRRTSRSFSRQVSLLSAAGRKCR